jgi:integrase
MPGHIKVTPRANGTIAYQAIVRVKGQETFTDTFDTREEAEQRAASEYLRLKELARKAEKQHALERTGRPAHHTYAQEKLRETLTLFRDSGEANRNQVVMLKTIVKNLCKDRDDVKLGDVKRSWVKRYVAKMRERATRRGTLFAWTTLAKHLQAMGAACKWRAEQLDLELPPLPFTTSVFPSGWDTKRERRFEAGEEGRLRQRLRRIRTFSRYHWRLLVRLALETGARLQEMVLATWREFDLARRLWTIPAEHTKGGKSRAVPLSRRALRVAKCLVALASPSEQRVFYVLGVPNVVSAGFHKFVMEAALPDFRFHDLRHEAISRMVLYKRQLSVFEIMSIVGHSSSEMLRRYANLRGDELVARMQ